MPTQYQYPMNKGGSLDFAIRLTNAGNAGTLTNVRAVVSAPEGWNAQVEPETIAASSGRVRNRETSDHPSGEHRGKRVQDLCESEVRPDREER